MRRLVWVVIVGSALAIVPGAVRAQVAMTGPGAPYRMNGYLAAPGYYGMSYGVPGVGLTRTYSEFSSSFGPGYGYGYAPYGLLPGRYGVGLWRPGFVAPGYVYGGSYYNTFAVPGASGPLPPVGLYAPGFGAGSPASYYGW